MFEQISYLDTVFAFIIYSSYKKPGIQFFTPSSFSQQLGYMYREKDYVIQPHIHCPVLRNVEYTKEVLFIKSGLVRVDFYHQDQTYFVSRTLSKGDVILLAYGGHGFHMLDDSEIIEVKQGPYAGEGDKLRFNSPADFQPNFNY